MKLGTGDPDGSAEGMADFLAAHAGHGKGFKTEHPSGLGGGRITIRCKGCGEVIERTSEGLAPEPPSESPPSAAPAPATRRRANRAEAIRDKVVPKVPALKPRRARSTPPPPPPPAKAPPLVKPPPAAASRPAPEASAAPRRRPRIGTAILAAIAIISAVVAVTRVAGEGDSSSEPSTPEPAQTPAPVPSPAPAPQSNDNSPAAEPAPPSSSGSQASQAGQTVRGPHYSVRMPQDWTKDVRDGAIVLGPAGSRDVEARLFYDESSSLSLDAMLTSAANLLRSENPGAKVSTPSRQGDRVTFVARYPEGSETATVVSEGDFRLLLLTRIDKGASAQDRAAAESMLASLKTS
jgi:hypothetical protein